MDDQSVTALSLPPAADAETAAEDSARDILLTATALAPGDVVVHAAHGLGRFERLVTLDVDGTRDVLEIVYRDGILMLPVEDLGLLSRYGPADAGVRLDRLGGNGWSTRKRRAVRKISTIARRLIGIAARRARAEAPVLKPDARDYRRFCRRFPFTLTPDQAAAVADVEHDLAGGRPMDRLVCGDVGSGKTEVALRAAFIAARAGVQVAIVVPTTLLARQHFDVFRERFDGLPVEIAQASRLSGGKEAAAVRERIASGDVDIAIGTHALLARSVRFARLGLIVIDEEQRFGVRHKERLKQLREGVHVLTLTATPIPRTMQLALSPVRDLSLIGTTPVGRLPVETSVGPASPPEIARALLAEHARGGQSFFVCPRIADLAPVARMLEEHAPTLRVAIAHGRMPPAELDRVMQSFGDREADVLLSTTIVESGLDVPQANTLIVHDAHRLGLAQLYQLRGRVGRSKAQAHALLTVPPAEETGETARRRLDVLRSLDTVGAGFRLASHDMDIRGAGSLVGEEQSGHVQDVGFDLFQRLLDRAIEALRRGELHDWSEIWVPRLALGVEARLPPDYVPGEPARLDLYWRLGQLETVASVDALADEIAAEHGPLPSVVDRLVALGRLRARCLAAGIASIEAGPKGAVIAFRPDHPRADLAAAARVLASIGPTRVKRDGRLVVKAAWKSPEARLAGISGLLDLLVR